MSDEQAPDYKVHPASLKPMSAGCIVPVVLAALVVGLAWMGLQKIVSNTGVWALQAADKSLTDTGLPADQREPFEAEIQRLRAAYEAETLESEGVVNGVAGLLESPILPLLMFNDLTDRRLGATDLSPEERAEFVSSIEALKAGADSQKVLYKELVKVLGPLAVESEEGASPPELDGPGFMAMAERAREAVRDLEIPASEVEPTYDVLLSRYRDHVDAVLAGTAAKVKR